MKVKAKRFVRMIEHVHYKGEIFHRVWLTNDRKDRTRYNTLHSLKYSIKHQKTGYSTTAIEALMVYLHEQVIANESFNLALQRVQNINLAVGKSYTKANLSLVNLKSWLQCWVPTI